MQHKSHVSESAELLSGVWIRGVPRLAGLGQGVAPAYEARQRQEIVRAPGARETSNDPNQYARRSRQQGELKHRNILSTRLERMTGGCACGV